MQTAIATTRAARRTSSTVQAGTTGPSIADRAVALADPYVKAWKTDLEIDRRMISENPGVPFVILLRENGSHCYLLHKADSEQFPKRGEMVPFLFGYADREKIVRESYIATARHVCNYFGALAAVVYTGQGAPRMVEPSRAVLIVEEWGRSVLHRWGARA